MSLSTGCLRVIYDEQKDHPLAKNPTVQIINVKAVTVQGGIRHRVIVSDGVNFMQAMLAQQHSALVEQEKIKKHSIVTLKEYVCNPLQNRKILIILNFDIVQTDFDHKVGTPESLENKNGAATSTPTTSSATHSPVPRQEPRSYSNSSSFPSSNNTANMQLDANVTSISNLNPYQTRWHIKARVTQKSEIKKWSNAKSEGQLFSVHLLDNSGEIKATCFNDQVDRLYHIFDEGKVYYISKARVTMAKKQFSTLNNEYELIFEQSSEIQACEETANIPQVKYSFVKIAKIENCEKDTNCDVIGVVTEDGGINEIITKSTGRPLKKRELTLADDSLKTIRLTLWGDQAESFDSSNNPVVACKGVRVNDFNGRSLSLSSSATIKINPDIPEAKSLARWYAESGNSTQFDSYSGMTGLVPGSSNQTKMTLQQAKDANLGAGGRVDYFTCRATISFIKSDTPAYPGCPDCRKKVVLEANGWRCEKCQKTFPSPQYRYMLNLSVEDATTQMYLQAFDDIGVAVLKMDANELMALKENDSNAAQAVFTKSFFNTYNFKVRAKQETYNEMTRTRYTCLEAQPIDFVKESKELVAAIEKLVV